MRLREVGSTSRAEVEVGTHGALEARAGDGRGAALVAVDMSVHCGGDSFSGVVAVVSLAVSTEVAVTVCVATDVHATMDMALVEDVHESTRRLLGSVDLQHGEQRPLQRALVLGVAPLAALAEVEIVSHRTLIAGSHNRQHLALIAADVEVHRRSSRLD
jgi:hypothetical protein